MRKASRHFVLLRSYFFLSDRRVSPGECGLASSDGNPGTNGVIYKLAAELGIKAESAVLQADIWKGATTVSADPSATDGFPQPPDLS
jgi:hypothetical protein